MIDLPMQVHVSGHHPKPVIKVEIIAEQVGSLTKDLTAKMCSAILTELPKSTAATPLEIDEIVKAACKYFTDEMAANTAKIIEEIQKSRV